MDKIPIGEIPINEIKNFAEYWQALVKAVEVISTLEMQNEKLVAINQEQFKKIKTLFAEIDKLKRKLDKQEQRIKELSDSERTLQLAEEELYQANKISDETSRISERYTGRFDKRLLPKVTGTSRTRKKK